MSFIIALSFDQQICFKSGRNLEIVLRCSKEQPAICFCFVFLFVLFFVLFFLWLLLLFLFVCVCVVLFCVVVSVAVVVAGCFNPLPGIFVDFYVYDYCWLTWKWQSSKLETYIWFSLNSCQFWFFRASPRSNWWLRKTRGSNAYGRWSWLLRGVSGTIHLLNSPSLLNKRHLPSPGEGAVTSWLVRSPLDRAVRVRALAGVIVLCSWARHITVTVPLSTQYKHNWLPANLLLWITLPWTSIPSRGE